MKKLLLASLMVVGLASFAFAQQGGMGMGNGMQGQGRMGGQGQGGGCCPMMDGDGNNGNMGGYHRGMHGGNGNMQNNNAEATVKTADEAKAKVQEVIKSDFKGYKVSKTEEFTGYRGHKGFRVLATDAGGNEFVFHVNPFGQVRGPMLAKNLPNNAPNTK